MLLGALFRLAFTTPPAIALSLQQQITRWIVLQKARRHTTRVLRLLVRTQFQDLFHSPSGVLLTFPSRYLFTIDRKIYLALEGGPSGFSQGFTCPDLLNDIDDKVRKTWYTGLSPSLAQLSNCFYSHYDFLLYRDGGSTSLLLRHPDGSGFHKRVSICHNPLITFVYQLIHLN